MHAIKPPPVLCVFEDDRYSNFFPLSLARPVFDLAIGAHTFKERLVDEVAPEVVAALCRPYLASVHAADETRFGGRPRVVNSPAAEGETLFLNGRLLAYGSELADLAASLESDVCLRKKGTIVAARLSGERALSLAAHIADMISDAGVERTVNEIKASSAEPAGRPREPGDREAARGKALAKWASQNGVKLADANLRLVSHFWQLIGENRACIADDFQKSPFRGTAPETELFRGVELINENDIVIGPDVEVRSGTVLDASEGAIVVANGVRIEPNAIIYGPCSIGEGSIIRGGAKIGHGTTIGRECRIGGEVEESVFSPFSNKQHNGFFGHSYAGSWVNIGAGSCTSDLKNNYGLVRAWTAGRMRDTGRRFLGATIGDHAKVAVNSRLNAGAVVGFNANVLSAGFAPKFVPSFTWQIEPEFVRCGLDDAIETARTMMDRRNVAFTEAHEELFRAVFRFCRLGGGSL